MANRRDDRIPQVSCDMNPSQPAFRKEHVLVADDDEAVGTPVSDLIKPARLRLTGTESHEV
ncbi:hypothetical protein [Rariglobus hedericola]|uniref:Uncharacterized protein n=1 Tax=Rariglobus hedericola TaxID=2597822 RepID=A0A556QPN1_9BACT|nr:hypothetical protein [Rariglobus hedericola]TSJ78595.1 hypothetical protein FPL22_04645 [Rariglobus hedericola]